MNSGIEIRGLACPFNEWAEGVDTYLMTVRPGAFAAGFRLTSPTLQFGWHDSRPIARRMDGNLRLFECRDGLAFQAFIPAENWATAAAIKRERPGCSIGIAGFMDSRIGFDEGRLHRTVNAVKLDHIAILNDPAFKNTHAWLAEEEEEGDDRFPGYLRNHSSAWWAGHIHDSREQRRKAQSAVAKNTDSVRAASRSFAAAAHAVHPLLSPSRRVNGPSIQKPDPALLEKIDAILAGGPFGLQLPHAGSIR